AIPSAPPGSGFVEFRPGLMVAFLPLDTGAIRQSPPSLGDVDDILEPDARALRKEAPTSAVELSRCAEADAPYLPQLMSTFPCSSTVRRASTRFLEASPARSRSIVDRIRRKPDPSCPLRNALPGAFVLRLETAELGSAIPGRAHPPEWCLAP